MLRLSWFKVGLWPIVYEGIGCMGIWELKIKKKNRVWNRCEPSELWVSLCASSSSLFLKSLPHPLHWCWWSVICVALICMLRSVMIMYMGNILELLVMWPMRVGTYWDILRLWWLYSLVLEVMYSFMLSWRNPSTRLKWDEGDYTITDF